MNRIKYQYPVTMTETGEDFKIAELNYFNKPLEPTSAKLNKSINAFDDEYHALCERVLGTGIKSEDRTGCGTISKFGEHLKFDLRTGFPLITTKKLNFKHIVNELLWLYSPKCFDLYALPEESQFLWKPWADENGYLGPIYGVNIRSWYVDKETPHIDQLALLIDNIKKNPYSRRHVITAWHVSLLDEMSLVPCHAVTVQFYVRNSELSCQVYIRSMDVYNDSRYIAMYAILTNMIAQLTDLQAAKLSLCLGDAYIKINDIELATEELKHPSLVASQLRINKTIWNFDEFSSIDFEVVYEG